ncbi:sodium channel modifier 1 [Eucyclogobius newberryi]|uniref:sodium channel modifier 1 n=1 Tax=Eucyclogobius newberryi TaxID=166745 RepID=UPI003B597C40
MSFKREGDDRSQLNVLKKRRVADLLSNYIPEDEATIMSNGRYTCLVCSYGPVFDTVDMLTVHRNGKRHLEGLRRFYGKKARLKNEIAKRKHENYIQSEENSQEASSSAPLLAQTRKLTHHALLRTVPYNSCHRKTSTKSEKQPASSTSDSVGQNSRPSEVKPTTTFTVSTCTTKTNTAGCPKELHFEESPPMSEQRKKELEHYIKLKSAGWIQDRSGQWLKDDNVEFDSDEEEPPSLSTS